MLDKTSAGDPPDQPETTGGSALRDALRRARAEAAERADVVIDLHAAEIARLDLLREKLDPVFADVPVEIDMFDVGLVPGDRPRLFVDMVSFVEMGRDRRTYRFMRDGRHGRVCAAQSDRAETIVEAVTAYVARRLVERERLLVDDDRLAAIGESDYERARMTPPTDIEQTSAAPQAAAAGSPAEPTPKAAAQAKRGWMRVLAILIAFGLGGALGAVVVAGLIVAVAKGVLPL